ncbi:MAG: putative 2-dehydropantoate 2-reductase [Kiritimatiellales bacterium]|nr:putative 2-dehydropantoate 2-reductase [Kiritimatiellales bacterium]
MAKKKHLAVIGAGAVGGFYGGLLQKAGYDVHFLFHSDYDYVRQNGLLIESVNGDFHLPAVNAYNDPREMPRCDVVMVCLKTVSNHILEDVLPCVVKQNGIVLSLQNGLGSEDEIAAITGPEPVIGGLCFLCSNKTGPGHIQHLDYGRITIAEYRADGQPGGITPRLKELATDLETTGLPIQMNDDLPLTRWKKLVWNIPFNGLSVVRNRLTSQLITEPESRGLCIALMREVAAASARCARPIQDEFIDKMIADSEKMTPYAPSMKLDYERGHAMEVESIYGNPLRAARAAGIDMPETAKLYQQLLEINQTF